MKQPLTGSDKIILSLVGVLAILVLGLVVGGIIDAVHSQDIELSPQVTTLLATIGGGIVGAAASYVVGGKDPVDVKVPQVVLPEMVAGPVQAEAPQVPGDSDEEYADPDREIPVSADEAYSEDEDFEDITHQIVPQSDRLS